MADRPTFEYDCDEGHHMVARKELVRCLAVVKGVPCPGTLKRIGKGSRTPAERAASHVSP